MQLILLITKHSLCVTCGSQWSVKLEEVAHSFFITMAARQVFEQNSDWIFSFLEGKCQNLTAHNWQK